MKIVSFAFIGALASTILLSGCSSKNGLSLKQNHIQGKNGVNTIVVLYLENRSFDSLFGNFPGVDGSRTKGYTFNQYQYNLNGEKYIELPMANSTNKDMSSKLALAYGMKKYPWENNKGLNSGIPNAPFSLDKDIKKVYPTTQNKDYMDYNSTNHPGLWYIIPEVVHRFYPNQYQINGIAKDKPNSLYVYFNSVDGETYSKYEFDGSRSFGIAMGYNDMNGTNLWKYAQKYTILDNFYQSAFGGSFLNHQFLVAARAPTVDRLPEGTTHKLSSLTEHKIAPCSDMEYTRIPCTNTSGKIYAVNTLQPLHMPFDPTTKPENRLPVQTHITIADRLSQKGISWKWYSGDYNQAMAGNGLGVNYQYHHNPLTFFKNYLPGTEGRKNIVDETELFKDISSETLPQVVFWKPSADTNAHPNYSNLADADTKVGDIVNQIQNSKYWKNSVIIITFDENGGLWDHKVPPKRDEFGPGTRIPAIIVSPFAKKGYIDSTEYTTTSILAFMESIFDLEPLNNRDKKMLDEKKNLYDAFEW